MLIHPVSVICFAACFGLVLSLWQRRTSAGSFTLIALTAALWGGIWTRVLVGDTVASVGVSFALLQLAPMLVFMGVLEHLVPATTSSTIPAFASGPAVRPELRNAACAASLGFAAFAATAPLHGLFVAVAADGGLQYLPASFAALGCALLVCAGAIYLALAKARPGNNPLIRNIVFMGFPMLLLGIGIASEALGWTIDGLNPVMHAAAAASAVGIWLLARLDVNQDESVRSLLFARLPDPVVALDSSSRIVDCNEAFADLLDYPLAELRGNLLSEVATSENAQALTEPDGQEFEVRWEHGESVVEHYAVSALALDTGTNTRVLHLTECDSHRHAQAALETADLRLERANASVDRLTLNDELTGLANQRRYLDELEKEIGRHQRSERRFGVIAIEADHFNLLAEQHGAAFRDRSLALIARAIEVEVRDTDLCARLNGEEFAVLAVQMKVPGLVNLAERIRKRVLKVRPHAPGGERIRMSVSLGVGIFNPKQDDLRSLLARTNRYLTEAKRSGRNQVVSDD